MSGEVRRVGLRAGRFIELDHEWVGLWKHVISLRPWSSCVKSRWIR